MKKTSQSLQQSLTVSRRELATTGFLNWREVQFTDFRGLGSQKQLKKLDLSNSNVSSLHTLQPQPQLKEIICDGSKLNNLAGLSAQPRLTSFSFKNTPLYNVENSRIAALICIGTRLSKLNGTPITQKERQIAACYPPIAQYLVENGWVVKYPPPSIHDFKFLADQFGINAKTSDFIAKQPPPDVDLPTQENPPSFDFSDDNDFTAGNFASTSLTQRLASMIRPLGFAIQTGNEERRDIVKAIAMICDAVQTIELQHSQL